MTGASRLPADWGLTPCDGSKRKRMSGFRLSPADAARRASRHARAGKELKPPNVGCLVAPFFAPQRPKELRMDARLLRLKQVMEIIPIGKSTWWAGVKSGRYPAPVKLGPKTTCWRAEDIRKLIDQAAG